MFKLWIKTKALMLIKEAESDFNYIIPSNTIKDMLHFELHLSQDLITEILEDYKQFTDNYKIEYSNKFRFYEGLNEITTRYVDDDLWFKECFNLLISECFRKFANIFMVQFLMMRVVFFSVYPQPEVSSI